ncbi:hypothetical protein ACJJTC_017654 [Scirpophaga incertulas]
MATELEEIKRERTNLRRIFTRKYKEIVSFVENVESDNDLIISAIEVSESRVQVMFDLDERIYHILVANKADESELDDETDQADSYRMKWIMLKKKVDKRLNPIENIRSPQNLRLLNVYYQMLKK